MKEKLIKNLGMKILSLCLAAVIWIIIINIDDPVIKSNKFVIPVTIINGSIVESQNLVYEVVEGANVDVIVSGKKSKVDKITSSDLKAVADLSELSKFNAVPISVSCTKYTSSVECILGRTKTLKVELEERDTQQFSPTIKQIGAVKEGYSVGEMLAKPNIIQVTGAKSQVAKIAEIRLSVDVSNASADFTTQAVPKVYNSKGEELDSDKYKFSVSEVTVAVQILKTKSIPVNIETVGSPAYGYEFVNAEYEPKKITIAGESNDLAEVSSVTIEVVLTGKSESFEETFDVTKDINKFPENVKITEGSQTIAVQVTIEKKLHSDLSFSINDIQVRNVPQNTDYQYVNGDSLTLSVRAMGLEESMQDITIADLNPFIDLEGLSLGEHRILVQFEPKDAISLSLAPYISIVLERKEVQDNPNSFDPEEEKNGDSIIDFPMVSSKPEENKPEESQPPEESEEPEQEEQESNNNGEEDNNITESEEPTDTNSSEEPPESTDVAENEE